MKKKAILGLAIFRLILASGPLAALTVYSSTERGENAPCVSSHKNPRQTDWICPNPDCDSFSHDGFDTCPFCDTPKPKIPKKKK